MKKIIAAIIRVIMPNTVRQHEREERNKRIHNAIVLQGLLNLEHNIRDTYNRQNGTDYTTKKACLKALNSGLTQYNCLLDIREADFRWCVVGMNENVDGTGSPAITLHSLYLYNNIYNKLDAAQNAKTYAPTSILNFISLL